MKFFQHLVGIAFADDALFFAEEDGPPSSVPAYALTDSEGRILNIGEEAAKVQSTPPPNMRRMRMTAHGSAWDPTLTGDFLARALKLLPKRVMKKRKLVIAVPAHRPAALSLRETALSVATEIYMVEHGMASAVGLGLPVQEPQPVAILSINEDWCEFAVAHLGSVTAQLWLPVGLASMIDDCRIHLRHVTQFVAEPMSLRAQFIKQGASNGTIESVAGWETWLGCNQLGREKSENLSPEVFAVGLMPSLLRITTAVMDRLNTLPPDTRLALSQTPLHLCGCGVHPPGIPEMIAQHLGCQVEAHRDPIHPAVLGAQKALREFKTIRKATRPKNTNCW
jgi:actin-like ATPase involved in cell morphogenesis